MKRLFPRIGSVSALGLSLFPLSFLGFSLMLHAETTDQQALSDLQELPFSAEITHYKPENKVSKTVDVCSIEAFENSQVVGFIRYFIDFEKQIGKISRIHVDKTHRKHHIGFNLFKQAIQDIVKRYPAITEIHWTAVGDRGNTPPGISLDALCSIYPKMVEKLGTGFELSIGQIIENQPARPMVLKITNNKIKDIQ